MIKADDTIDCLGLQCPMPIIKISEKIAELEIGQIVEVIADDPGVEEDIPNWCRTTSNEFLGMERKDDQFRAFVRKMVQP
ncbi:MAG: sulfurtransferase TusA family protein [bacterium]|nr:sulfurtransferase TusA family protein [bacterium]